jgi:hypothetical protein
MVYWLLRVISGGVPTTGVGGTPNYPSAMQIGKFTELEACEAAAKEARLLPVRQGSLVVVSGFVCVRAGP